MPVVRNPNGVEFYSAPDIKFNALGFAVGLIVIALFVLFFMVTGSFTVLIAGVILGLLLMWAIRVADQWEKAVVLRLGKFLRLAGPGPFFIIPIIDTVPVWIDMRVKLTVFRAEQTLTKDTVPVDVDAVLFWLVVDAKKAALSVERYNDAVAWAAQTALRDVIGRTHLAELLSEREKLDLELKKIIDEKTEPWGISVQSVEIRDIVIPQALQDAMSRQAQAERERQARIILGEAEVQIANKFVEAAKAYSENPTALHLRAMNMLYEGLKEKGALIVVPSSAVDTMGLGGITGLSSLAATVKNVGDKKEEAK